MDTRSKESKRLRIGNLKLEIYPNGRAVGTAIAQAAAEILWRLDDQAQDIGMIFATGLGQLDVLEELTSIPDLPWDRIGGFIWMNISEFLRTIQPTSLEN